MNAILVGLKPNNNSYYDESMLELKKLCQTLEIDVVDMIFQKSLPNNTFYVGKGKAHEISEIVKVLNVDIVIFDDSLSPRQIKNLSTVIEDAEVIDRSFLVLRIFEQRARSKKSKLEVKLAKSIYMLPRLYDDSLDISKSGGGSFTTRGAGETKLEILRRNAKSEIYKIKKELDEINLKNETSKKLRKSHKMPIVCLIGYTNAGKSSLYNSINNMYGQSDNFKEVLADDKLFLTLDTKSSVIKLDNKPPFILIDTIGFIDKIPLEIINSFKSTFADMLDADLIIEVIDGAIQNINHVEIDNIMLKTLGINNTEIIQVMTKKDLFNESKLNLDLIHVSNKTRENIDLLLDNIYYKIYPDNKPYNLFIPFSKFNIYHEIKSNCETIFDEYIDDGIKIKALLSEKDYNKYKTFII